MIGLSALLVFGTTALIVLNLASEGPVLRPGFEQMIHARIPWVLLGALWVGSALGVAAVFRRWAWYKLGVVLLELPLVALASWYFLVFSYLPDQRLRISVSEPFPAYALLDHEGQLRRYDASTAQVPALYIFYRGDW